MTLLEAMSSVNERPLEIYSVSESWRLLPKVNDEQSAGEVSFSPPATILLLPVATLVKMMEFSSAWLVMQGFP
jgi:hypothetical protein